MNPALAAAVWALVTIDCGLMGYRLAMGRVALLDKVRRHRRAAGRAALAVQVPLAAVVALAAVVTSGSEVDAAMGRFVLVGGTYAALILGTWALCVIPSAPVRTAASVVVFGPLTLLRPVVVVATVVAAVGDEPSAGMVVVGVLVAVPGVLVEPLLARRTARRLLAPAPGALSAGAD